VLLHTPALTGILDSVQHGALRLRDELQLDGITCRLLTSLDKVPAPVNASAVNASAVNASAVSAPPVDSSLVSVSGPSMQAATDVTRNIQKFECVGNDKHDETFTGQVPHLLLLDAAALTNGQAQNVENVLCHLSATSIPHTCILIGDDGGAGRELLGSGALGEEEVFAVLSASPRPGSLRQIARRALDHCALQARASGMERELELYTQHLKELNRIGVALSSERDLDTLLELILTKSRDITNSDASSLYLVEPDPAEGANGRLRLRFKLSQNDSLTFSVNQPMPISRESLAGYVALTGESLRFEDVYEIGPEVPYRFNRSFDESHGYRTKSMLVVPMHNHKNDIIGVLQLINRKTHRRARLENRNAVEREVLPFSDLDLEMTESLASQAAVAIENSSLYQDIENLFEGFVTASARAIEQRDPTTSGHSERVAILTVELADRISRLERGPFADIVFSPTQIKELRYAALLHDFGKVGVREDVLLKRNKLHAHEFDLLRMRFELVRTQRERELALRKVQALLAEDRESLPSRFQVWDKQLEDEMHEMDDFMTLVTRANDPLLQWMSDEEFERQQSGLARLRHVYYRDRAQSTRPLLNDYELRALSVRRGSLDEVERREIECHVTHTFEFLNQIPWTREYEMVPRIAYCHHERCNGTGYPRGLTANDISLQSRMMTIVDIYDALTASDRPYKKACTSDRAIDILYQEAQDGNIDRDVLDVFVTYHVWKLTQGWKKRS
jgi:HD-GYP domain-containing protein (c-di-GMP phosphodiesterase class II)